MDSGGRKEERNEEEYRRRRGKRRKVTWSCELVGMFGGKRGQEGGDMGRERLRLFLPKARAWLGGLHHPGDDRLTTQDEVTG